MKTGILNSILIITLVLPMQVFAQCDFKTGITKADQGYNYTVNCHKKVGKIVADLKDSELQIKELNLAITNQRNALNASEEQVQLWQMEAYNQNQKLLQVAEASKREKWIYFGLGIVVMSAAVYTAGQLR